MNTLHSLINDAEKLDYFYDPRLDIAYTSERMQVISEIAKNAIAFNLGQADDLAQMPAYKTKLPFEVCWFEFNTKTIDTGTRVFSGCLAVENENKSLIIFAFYKNKNNRWTFIGESKIEEVLGEKGLVQNSYHIGMPKEVSEDMGNTLAHCAHVISSACLVMNCKNVIKVENKPSKLAKMRGCNKRKKLFSTWTLHIKSDRKEYEPRGGTHASPRVHLRRGHVRQFKPGQYTWVPSCLVRGKSPGMIHKDYALCSA